MTTNNFDLEAQLKQDIKIISRALHKKTSYKHNFTMSIVTGVGAAIGATIVFGMVISAMAQVIDNSQNRPLLTKIIDMFQLQTVVQTYQKPNPTPQPMD